MDAETAEAFLRILEPLQVGYGAVVHEIVFPILHDML